MRIIQLLEAVAQVNAILIGLVDLAERPGDGSSKRETVIAQAKTAINALPINGIVKFVFTQDVVLGVMVDFIVKTLNELGWFTKSPTDGVTEASEVPA